jgi:hypothetical protein
MKLAHAAGLILVLTAIMSIVGFFLDPHVDAVPRAIGFGVLTFVFSSIAAFIVGFIATRKKRLPAIIAVSVVLLTVGAATVIAYFAGSEEEAIPRAFAIGFLTLIVGGGVSYLAYYFWAVKTLDISAEELDDKEVVWAKTAQSMVHYKSGNPLRFWEAVGGRLFLTNQVLEFRSFPAELYSYRLIIPLCDIRRAKPYSVLGFIAGGLRVERRDGSYELFTFGAAFDQSREWADAIMDFRDDLAESADDSLD